MKRIVDTLLIFTILPLLLPAMLLLIWQVRRKLSSPVFFRQTRPSLRGGGSIWSNSAP